MRIAVSLLSLRPGLVGGAETYVRALLRHLPAAAGGDELVAVMDEELARALPTPGFRREVLPLSAAALVRQRILEAYTPWRARDAVRRLRALAPDVTLFPQQSVFPAEAPG